MSTRLAILADIHANVWALDAVLAHFESREVDGIVNLGDSCMARSSHMPHTSG